MAEMTLISKLRPSPATVISVIALVVAMGGTAYAAVALPAGSVGTRQLKDEAVTSVKVKDHTLRAVDLRPSLLADASVMVARINSIPSTFDQPLTYGSPAGTSSATTVAVDVEMITPNVEMTASHLAVNLTVQVNNNSARRFTLMVNRVETALTCTVQGLSYTCTSTGAVAISGGSLISIRSDKPAVANADPTQARVSFLLTQ